ncbi:polyprotein [Striga asiatica]|uniref:Polyprotein n=1 Tax=Striga asiatica TaxID=4170 RepID=A0A5A7NXH8_STRAF|nr:polyprotein [Striga asiatica]
MVATPALSKHLGSPVEHAHLYGRIVGALQYLTMTRPDINFAVNKVSQFMQTPVDTHWKAVKSILRYVAGTKHFTFRLSPCSNLNITGFADADWASDVDDRRSTSGFRTFMGQNLISWSSKKQTTVSRSSTEAEYRSLAHAACEIMWIKSLLRELRVKDNRPSVIWVDNLGAIQLAANPIGHSRTKHIELDLHFLREKIVKGVISVRHVPAIDQVSDILTKPLNGQFFTRLGAKLCVDSQSLLELRGHIKGLAYQTIWCSQRSPRWLKNGPMQMTRHTCIMSHLMRQTLADIRVSLLPLLRTDKGVYGAKIHNCGGKDIRYLTVMALLPHRTIERLAMLEILSFTK